MNKENGENRLEGCVITIRVIPRAKSNQVIGFMLDGRLKIKIKSAPIDGKANHSLKKYLGKLLGVRKGAIEIISGQSARNKRVQISGLGANEVRSLLIKASSINKN